MSSFLSFEILVIVDDFCLDPLLYYKNGDVVILSFLNLLAGLLL